MSGDDDLFGWNEELPDERFNGPEYVPDRDHARLRGQILRVFTVMKDGQARTLEAISEATKGLAGAPSHGDPVASVSAQLRHLRKERFGAHTVEREHLGNGLFSYRLIQNTGGAGQ